MLVLIRGCGWYPANCGCAKTLHASACIVCAEWLSELEVESGYFTALRILFFQEFMNAKKFKMVERTTERCPVARTCLDL